MATVQLFRREARELRAVRRDRPRAPRREHRVDLLLRGVLPGDRGDRRARDGADHLVRRRRGCSRGALTLGSLVAFIQYSQRFFRPISDMSEKFNLLQSAMASSERIFKLLDTQPTIVSVRARQRQRIADAESRGRGPLPAPAPAAGAHRLRPRLVRLHTARTTCCGRVVRGAAGPARRRSSARPGPGKSTLINLLLRFYDVSRGRILVDGVDIREMDLGGAARRCSASCCRTCSCSRARSRQHPARQRRDRRRRRCGGRPRRCTPTRSSTGCRAGYASAGRRARRDAVGRAEAAAVVRARARLRSARPDPRRGDVERRHRDRAADPRRAEGADGRPHDDRDRAPAVDDPGHGPDPGAPQGRAARVRHAPGAARRARHLLPAVSAAVQGPGGDERRRSAGPASRPSGDRTAEPERPEPSSLEPCARQPCTSRELRQVGG